MTIPIASLKRWTAVAGALVIVLFSAGSAAANCQNGTTAQSVVSGNNLSAIIAASHPPCTVSVGPGTYYAPTNTQFTISDGITVRSTAGAAATTLVSDRFTAVTIWPIGGSCPSGATLEGFTLEGPEGGLFAGAGAEISHPGCASNQVTNLTLRRLIVSASTTPSNGHGIELYGARNSVIDSCTVVRAYANGILVAGGSGNIVMNSAVLYTETQHAIAVHVSNDNVVVGNTVSGSAFDGILLNAATLGGSGPGSSRNRVERNTISGHKYDGVTLDGGSHFNYVGLNTAVSSSYHPVSKPDPSPTMGVGIWVNNASNANFLFGNDVSGSPENGIDVLTSKSTYIQANNVHGNYGGGIWIANWHDVTIDPNAPPPQDTVLHGNNIFFNTFNGQIYLQGVFNSDVAYNFLSGAQAGTLAGPNTTAVLIKDSDWPRVYENTTSEVSSRAFVYGATTNAWVFRNRFVKGTNVPNPPQTDGRNGLTWALAPAVVHWDAGSLLGGNHWSEFSQAAGNPDPAHPYTAFVGNNGAGPNVDRFPYRSETLEPPNQQNSVAVFEPIGSSVLASGTRKTIRWSAQGCVLVDLYYSSGATAPTLIASGSPNTGYYFWNVPAAPLRNDYYVVVVCAGSNGLSLGVAGNSPSFTIASSELVLLNPGRATRAIDNGVVRVAWKASASVSAVNIFVKSGSGGETQVATNVTGTTFRDIDLPPAVSSSNRVTIRIQDAGSSARQDSVDGYFMVRGGSPSFGTVSADRMVRIGSTKALEWTGVSTSYTVDLDLVGQTTTPIARNLPDFGSYTWLVPDAPAAAATIRATFIDVNGNRFGSVDSAAFSVVADAIGSSTPNDLDGDRKSEIAVFRPSTGTWYISYSSVGYTSGEAFEWGASGDVPVAGDYDGDGQTDIAVFRPSDGVWYLRYTNSGATTAFAWGAAGDVPAPGDYNGDGKTDLALYRPSTGAWWIWYTGSTTAAFQWGSAGDIPVPGDYNGDGKTDLALYRPSDGGWWIWYSGTSTIAGFHWGAGGEDVPVTGDFNGDGTSDLGIFRPSTGTWWIWYTGSTTAAVQWGLAGDVPVSGDYDGDGKTDLAIFRPSTGAWWILYSSTGTYASYQWGAGSDVPIVR